MTICTPISTCTKNVVCSIGNVHRQMIVRVSDAFLQSSCHYYATKANSCSSVNVFQRNCFGSVTTRNNPSCHSLSFKRIVSPRHYRKTHINVSNAYQNMDLRLLVPKQTQTSKIKFNLGPFSWQQRGVSTGLFIGLLVCFSTSQPSYAEVPEGNEKGSHTKKVLTDYSVIGQYHLIYPVLCSFFRHCLMHAYLI